MMKPVIKWSGSKRTQADRIIAFFPETYDVYYNTLFNRIKYYGWSFEDAIKYKDGRCKDYRKHKQATQA